MCIGIGALEVSEAPAKLPGGSGLEAKGGEDLERQMAAYSRPQGTLGEKTAEEGE